MSEDRVTYPGAIAATIIDEAYQEDQEQRWANLEERVDHAICELMFNEGRAGTPSLGVLVGIFRTPNALPDAATEAARKLDELIAEHANDAAKLSEEQRIDLANELVAFLRFVCHRGDEA